MISEEVGSITRQGDTDLSEGGRVKGRAAAEERPRDQRVEADDRLVGGYFVFPIFQCQFIHVEGSLPKFDEGFIQTLSGNFTPPIYDQDRKVFEHRGYRGSINDRYASECQGFPGSVTIKPVPYRTDNEGVLALLLPSFHSICTSWDISNQVLRHFFMSQLSTLALIIEIREAGWNTLGEMFQTL